MKKHVLPSQPRVLLVAAGLSALSACAVNPQTGQLGVAPAAKATFASIYDSPDPCSNNARNIGITLGIVLGGAIGYHEHGRKGAAAGAALGGAAGGLVGHLMDARRCNLYKIAQANHLRLASAAITPAKLGVRAAEPDSQIGLDVQLQNRSDEFLPGSATLTPQARGYITQIANQYTPQGVASSLPADATPQQRAQAAQRIVLIVGHTDAQDSAAGADPAQLSQERASAVAQVFAQAGVPPANIYYQGAGDALPIASNRTAQGREANNRVQFVDVPSSDDLQQYLRERSVNPTNYETGVAAATTPPAAPDVEPAPAQHPATAAHDHAAPYQAPTRLAHATASAPARRGKPIVSSRSRAHATASAGAANAHQPQSRAAASVAQAQPEAARPGSAVDFGGQPAGPQSGSIDLGAPIEHSMFNIIPSAHADTQVRLESCLGDRPHRTTEVRNLGTGQALPPRDFVPGFYGTVWASNVQGNLVAVTGAAIPLDSGAPVPRPTVLIYKDYRGDATQTPTFQSVSDVNVYRGAQNTLYRVFVNGPARCLDLVVPTAQSRGQGNLYYPKNGRQYVANPHFAMISSMQGKQNGNVH